MNNSIVLKKKLLVSSVAAVLSVGVAQTAQADIYYFTFANGGCNTAGLVDLNSNGSYLDPGDVGNTCTGAGDATFTMLTSTGSALQNTSYPYYADTTWGYGKRTQIGGSVTIDPATHNGVAAITPFDFYNNGSAVASGITMVEIDSDPNSNGNMWLGNMIFDWSVNNGIPVSIVWDMSGLVGALNGPSTAATISGVGALPASDGMKGSLPIGASPIATTTWDTTVIPGTVLGTNPSGELPLVSDTIGGSPMQTVPFAGFNANFDFTTLTFAGYNDTTRPVLTLGSTSVNVAVSAAFDANNPGVAVTCADNADGNDDITAAAGTNANISFNTSGTVNTAIEGNYSVTYTCTDNASARTPIADDPNIAGVQATVPANNTSTGNVLTVIVGDPNRPAITILGANPLTHEACTAYTDPGATATDLQDGDITGSIVVSGDTINAGSSEGSYSVIYDVSDNGAANPGAIQLDAITQTRTVDVVDSIAPVLSVIGGSTIGIESTACATYVKPQATVTDTCHAPVTSPVSTGNTVTCTVPTGQDTIQSSLSYSADDTAAIPNTGTTSAIVTVSRSEPVITLIGGGVTLDVGVAYTEQGMNIHDVQNGDLANVIASGSAAGSIGGTLTYSVTSNVNTAVRGNYTVTYDVTDSNGNAAVQVVRNVKVGAYATGSNFTMLNPLPSGTPFGGTNDIVMDWDGTSTTDIASTNFSTNIYSAGPTLFFDNEWTAHHIRVFGPGDYTFDTTCTTTQLEAGTSDCGGTVGQKIHVVVATGQYAAHILFDWNGSTNIDVVNVWNQSAVWDDPDANTKNDLYPDGGGVPPDPAGTWDLVSIDADGDGINGVAMVDGPFVGYSANFSMNPSGQVARTILVMTAPNTKLGTGAMSVGMLMMSLFSLIGSGLYRKLKQ